MIYKLAIFLPFFGAIIPGLFGRQVSPLISQIVSCMAIGFSGILSIIIFYDVALGGNEQIIFLMTWIDSGSLNSSWSLRFDTLSAVMVATVSCVSFLIHVYSIGYMSHDTSKQRFMCYLSLFTFAMLILVTADNLVQLFFGWEGVGLFSYLLIGFWYTKPSANYAAIKAFVVNRVGDFGFLLGIFGIYLLFDSVNFNDIFVLAPEYSEYEISFFSIYGHAYTLICMLLFIGAMGKSAQLFLHTWLPDAMEGPTPVSALIHAATMVTAGVFLVARMSPIFEYSPFALSFVTFIGASTAFFAASIACVQNDIKRVIAYSTCSQLGYMFFACGVGAYSAGIFHLMTHAWFKALLFLGAGSVIHAMSDEQDMRKMGGLWSKIKITYVFMCIGSLALLAVPPFAGYYSKDMILEVVYSAGTQFSLYAFLMGILAALMTAFYSTRLILLTFHGISRVEDNKIVHVHESPYIMIVPLFFLSLGAVFSGIVGYELFVGDSRNAFWGNSISSIGVDVIEAAHHAPIWVILSPLVVTLFGFLLAVYMYVINPRLPKELSDKYFSIYNFLLNKWYFDELYDRIFVKPFFYIGNILWKKGDEGIIDRFGPNFISSAFILSAKKLSVLQSGYLYHYAFVMIIAVAVFVSWLLLRI